MPGLIEELVSDASDATKPVSQLLRRMKVAAVRLKLDDTESWVEHELNGYPQDGSPLPAYRNQSGTPMGDHVRYGPQPLTGGNAAIRTALSNRPLHQSLSSIEDLLSRPEDGIFWFPYSEPLNSQILDMNRGIIRSAGLQMDGSRLRDVVDSVRDRILTWALSMEKAGVTGAGMSFTPSEQKAAANVTNIFYGDNARINQNSTDNSTNTVVHGNLFGDLKTRILAGVADPTEQAKLVAAVEEMEIEQGKPGYAAAYGKFVALAANHIQIVQPFLEGLTGMLSNLP